MTLKIHFLLRNKKKNLSSANLKLYQNVPDQTVSAVNTAVKPHAVRTTFSNQIVSRRMQKCYWSIRNSNWINYLKENFSSLSKPKETFAIHNIPGIKLLLWVQRDFHSQRIATVHTVYAYFFICLNFHQKFSRHISINLNQYEFNTTWLALSLLQADCMVDIKLGFINWFFYNLIILIK